MSALTPCSSCCSIGCDADDAIDYRARAWGATKCGYAELISNGTDIPKYYLTKTYWTRLGTCVYTAIPGEASTCEYPDGVGSDCPFPSSDCAGATCTDTPTRTECTDAGGVCSYVELSDEDTYEAIVARAAAERDGTPWENCLAGGSRDEPDDQTYISLSEMQFRARHKPSSTCYMKMWYAADLYTLLFGELLAEGSWIPFYEWRGEGVPCFGGAAHGGDQVITGDWITVEPPDVNGALSVRFWVSCVEGEEPPIGEVGMSINCSVPQEGPELGANGLAEGLETSGSLTTGHLTTGGLQTGTLETGTLQTGSVQTGTLSTGSLQTGGLNTGSLNTGSLQTGTLQSGALETGNLQTGTLQTGTLRTGYTASTPTTSKTPITTNHLTTGSLQSGSLSGGF